MIHHTNPIPWVEGLARWSQRWGIDCISQSDPRYESQRLIFNRLHDLRPGALVRTASAELVGNIVRFAGDNGLSLAIRGGGHHIAGYGSCDGGLVIDFSPFRRVCINSATGTVEVEPGARLGDIDRELTPHRLVIPTGTVSETGIAGLTLGGGIGWLVGQYGLTCDQLIGADVVLADGQKVRAEAPEHRDLLWALRGGGGNFGVVTRFRYRPQPLPVIVAGTAIVEFNEAKRAALERIVTFLTERCPSKLTVAPSLTRSPAGVPRLSVDFCMAGADDGTLRAFQTAVGPARWMIYHNLDYTSWQRCFDHLSRPPMRGYWKARYTAHLTQTDIDILFEEFLNAPACRAPLCRTTILLEHLHGAFTATGIESAAFPLRSARFGVLFSARWAHPSSDRSCISWVRSAFNRLDPFGTSATYSNYTPQDDSRAVNGFDGKPAPRLVMAKKYYDPSNLFNRNHNILSSRSDSATLGSEELLCRTAHMKEIHCHE
jgi:hypothetical protein